MDPYVKHMAALIADRLVGATIQGSVVDQTGEYFGLDLVRNGKRLFCFINQDPEGNDPGFLDIEEADDAMTIKQEG